MKKSRPKTPKTQAKKKQQQQQQSAELKQFRHEVSILKAKGLISKKVDARTVKPTKELRSRVAEFKDVINGSSKVWKVSKRQDFYNLINGGERGANMRIVLPKSEYLYKNMVAYKTDEDEADGKKARKFRKSRKTDLEDHIRNMSKKMPLKEGDGYYFTFYGNVSSVIFFDIDELLRKFMNYGGVQAYRKKLILTKADEIIAENFELHMRSITGYTSWRGPTKATELKINRKFIEAVPQDLIDKFGARTTKRKSKRDRIKGR